jgi:VanZ family protein
MSWLSFKPRRNLKLRPYAPAIGWGAFLLFLGGRDHVPAVPTDLPLDKAAHFLLYAVLGWLAARGWLRVRQPAWHWPLLCALLLGVVDELNQRAVPGRSADPFDSAADAAGSSLAYTLRTRRAAAPPRSSE